MKKNLNITANLYDPGLLKSLVEKVASTQVDFGFNEKQVPDNWNAMSTCCTVAHVMGNFSIQNDGQDKKQLSVPFTSCFLFTCIREKYGLFNLEWSSSLS